MSSKAPKVSVCMITYNHEVYIKQAVEGVLLQQTNFKLELIISDDCSTDQTKTVIKEIIKNHSDAVIIKYIRHDKNIGIMPNFVFTLKECCGKYIALCEGDDYWIDPFKLQKQVDFMEANPNFSGCFHSTYFKDEINKKEEKLWRTYSKNEFTIEDTLSTISLFHTTSFVFKREFLNVPTWFNKIGSGDMALFTLIASKGPLYYIDEPMSVYRKNEGGITNSISLIAYHNGRIRLFEYLNKEFDYKYQIRIVEILNYHKKELTKLKKNKLRSLLKKSIKKFK